MKRPALLAVFVVLVVSVFPLGSAPLIASGSSLSPVNVLDGSVRSTNWSGYAVNSSSGSITAAGGSWVVPPVICPSSGSSYSSYWVGIDGFQSSTVEQTGTDSDCRNGVPTYYAWYEFYPNPSHKISGITVHAGDVIGAKVTFASGTFKAAIKDITTGALFSTSATVSGAARSSAEFIVEAPVVCTLFRCKLASLANFGSVGFGYDSTGVKMTCDLTMNGVTGSIGSFGSSVQEITMVSQSSISQVKAQPSPLTTDGTSFTVQWLSSGP